MGGLVHEQDYGRVEVRFIGHNMHMRCYTRNCLTFVKAAAIEYEQNLKALGNFLPICNFCKQAIISVRDKDFVQDRVYFAG